MIIIPINIKCCEIKFQDSLKEYNMKLKQELQKITISQSLADKLKDFKTTSASKSSNEVIASFWWCMTD